MQDQPFKSFQMGVKERRFIEEVKKSWKIVAQKAPDKELEKYCQDLGFEGKVSGLVKIFTISLPDYSFVDFKRNSHSEEIAGTRWMMAIRPPKMTIIEPVLFYQDGFAYIMLAENLIQAYENGEDGLGGSMYVKKGEF